MVKPGLTLLPAEESILSGCLPSGLRVSYKINNLYFSKYLQIKVGRTNYFTLDTWCSWTHSELALTNKIAGKVSSPWMGLLRQVYICFPLTVGGIKIYPYDKMWKRKQSAWFG